MSLRKAINEKCKDCIYDPLAGGTWLKQVGDCIDTPCPLHPYRPGQDNRNLEVNSLVKRSIPEGLKRFQEQKRASKLP